MLGAVAASGAGHRDAQEFHVLCLMKQLVVGWGVVVGKRTVHRDG